MELDTQPDTRIGGVKRSPVWPQSIGKLPIDLMRKLTPLLLNHALEFALGGWRLWHNINDRPRPNSLVWVRPGR